MFSQLFLGVRLECASAIIIERKMGSGRFLSHGGLFAPVAEGCGPFTAVSGETKPFISPRAMR